jgi:uncharacterized protein
MTIALVTGASSGIGAVYARRLAARGHDLVLVARATDRLNTLATELRNAHGIAVEVITADLVDGSQLEPVLRRLRLNVIAPTLLASAVVGRMVERGNGAIINIASVLALLPEYSRGIYPATKSYLMTLSQGLAAEVASKGVYVQAVLPAATRTEIYERAGGDASKVPNVMEVEDLVDAALVGFDRKELVTIPPVPDVAAWDAFEKARGVLAAGFGNSKPAARYRA